MTFFTAELIRKKRDGLELSEAEIEFLVKGFGDKSIPDYQASAWLMAAYLKSLSKIETVHLTRAVRNSGKVFHWRKLSVGLKNAVFADKHSTGGVGDKVSLVLAPVAACLGLKVPMMSGRGLGHTGGTVDKLESIPGFTMQPAQKRMIECLETVGACMMSQTDDICPADKRLYHLRDVTGTIESIPLITASIVSKKWAEGVDAIVFDVKCGEGAFMGTFEQACALAHSLVDVATGAGLKARACVTRMEEPLGAMIGNATEVRESVWMLSDRYPSKHHRRMAKPLLDLSLALAAEMAVLAGTRPSFEVALSDAQAALTSGKAMHLFQEMARLQGAYDDWETRLPQAKNILTIEAPRAGHVARVLSRNLGLLGIRMGAGRETITTRIDPAVGIEMAVLPGDAVERGQPLMHLHLHDNERATAIATEVKAELDSYIEIKDGSAQGHASQLILEKIPS